MKTIISLLLLFASFSVAANNSVLIPSSGQITQTTEIPQPKVEIAEYDPVTGVSRRFYGNSMSYPCSNPELVKVKIFAKGMKTISEDHVDTINRIQSNQEITIESAYIQGETLNVILSGNIETDCVGELGLFTPVSPVTSMPLETGCNRYQFELPANSMNYGGLLIVKLSMEGNECQTIKIMR